MYLPNIFVSFVKACCAPTDTVTITESTALYKAIIYTCHATKNNLTFGKVQISFIISYWKLTRPPYATVETSIAPFCLCQYTLKFDFGRLKASLAGKLSPVESPTADV